MSAKVYDTDPTVAEIEARQREGVIRVVRRPRRSTWTFWLSAGIASVADQIELTNHYLEEGRGAKAAQAFLGAFSLRPLAPLLPGGGVLRGARNAPRPVVPAATPAPTTRE